MQKLNVLNYSQLSNIDVLYYSNLQCIKGVKWKTSVQRFQEKLLLNLCQLSNELKTHTYKQREFYSFTLHERGKVRNIRALSYRDRVVQRGLCDFILFPLVKDKLIHDNGSSQKGKGISFARRRFSEHLQKAYRKWGNNYYILTIDFKNYFGSIPYNKLKSQMYDLLRGDIDTYNLLSNLIDSFNSNRSSSNPCGVGIGSQMSQIIGIYYPTRLDTFIKIVKSCKFYGRYTDDLYIMHESKSFLKSLVKEIQQVANNLGLTLNTKKTNIIKVSKFFVYLKVKYKVTNTGKVIKVPVPKTFTRERRKIKKYRKLLDNGKMSFNQILQSFKSWCGSYKHYNCRRSLINIKILFNKLFSKELNMRESITINNIDIKNFLSYVFNVPTKNISYNSYNFTVCMQDNTFLNKEQLYVQLSRFVSKDYLQSLSFFEGLEFNKLDLQNLVINNSNVRSISLESVSLENTGSLI